MTARELPVLAGERVVLRLLEPSAAERAARFFRDNRDHLAPWDPPFEAEAFTAAYWEPRLASNIENFEQDRSARLWVLLRANDEVIGTCGLSNIVRGVFQACHLGYRLGQRFEGQGYMSEALRLVLPYAFEQLGLHRVMANYMPHNERSARLLERLGFEIEGRARDYLFIAGEWRDHVLTSLVNPAPRPPL